MVALSIISVNRKVFENAHKKRFGDHSLDLTMKADSEIDPRIADSTGQLPPSPGGVISYITIGLQYERA